MNSLDLLGFLGMALLLSAFLLNQLKVFATGSLAYELFNFIGAYILSYYAYILGNTPFLILEFVWGSFALYRLIHNISTTLLKKVVLAIMDAPAPEFKYDLSL